MEVDACPATRQNRERDVKERQPMKQKIPQIVLAVLACASASAQVNSGSNGSDGVFNPAQNHLLFSANRDTL